MEFVRRLGASTVEIFLIACSALVPFGMGWVANSDITAERVPLNPVLVGMEDAIARLLAIPSVCHNSTRTRTRPVLPLVNGFCTVALVAPVFLGSRQLYCLEKTGQTLPKQWFHPRVVTRSHAPE